MRFLIFSSSPSLPWIGEGSTMRWLWLIGTLLAAFVLTVVTSQTPRPVPASAPATQFSAERAMADVRQIARAPHPMGSAEHARVQAYLLDRMAALGLQTSTQAVPLADGQDRWSRRNPGDPAAARAVNLIGVLPGRDPALPAVVLMAHYDTTPKSPGAADDTTGVAAILEAVRAIRARGPADRTVIVLLTDAEELGLDGARGFFADAARRAPVGHLINLESRGGGGRASMFETGRGNAETIAAFQGIAPRVTGGVSSTSLSVFVYERMPNSTDFTLAKDRGIQGINLAFTGRPAQYHTPLATPDNLDQGSVQHIGSQALEMADALARAPALPQPAADVVYSDILGGPVIAYPPAIGWIVLGLAALLAAFAVWRARRTAGLTFADLGRGVVDGLWLLTSAMVLAQAVRAVGGPAGGTNSAYYTLMARLPWLEAGVTLAVLGLGLVALTGRGRLNRLWIAGAVVLAAAVSTVLGGVSPLVLAPAVVALGLSLVPGLSARSTWGGWTGLIVLVLAVGLLAQALAPTTAHFLVWPALLTATAAALAAALQPGLTRPVALIAPALAAILGGAWLMAFWHGLFLGVGMDLPGAVAFPGLLILMLLRPLAPELAGRRVLIAASGGLILLGLLVSAAGWIAIPTLPPMN